MLSKKLTVLLLGATLYSLPTMTKAEIPWLSSFIFPPSVLLFATGYVGVAMEENTNPAKPGKDITQDIEIYEATGELTAYLQTRLSKMRKLDPRLKDYSDDELIELIKKQLSDGAKGFTVGDWILCNDRDVGQIHSLYANGMAKVVYHGRMTKNGEYKEFISITSFETSPEEKVLKIDHCENF